MPDPHLINRPGQLDFIEKNWDPLMKTWCQRRATQGPGVMAVVVDDQNPSKPLVPANFMHESQLADLVENYEGSQAQQIAQRNTDEGHLGVVFIHRDNKFLHVDSYSLRLKTSETKAGG